jgi:hypothetical protein
LPPKKIGELVALLLCVTIAGCRHQANLAQPSGQTQTPNIFDKPPDEAKLPPMQSDPPPTLIDAKPAMVAEEVKPKKKPKRQPAAASAAAATPAPATVAVATQPPAPGTTATPPLAEDSTLGALAPGGDTDPKQQQEVADKISAVDKRLNDLPPATADREQKQIAKVKLFLKEASDALKGGDVEGAKILATKAELLLDDLQKSS